MPDVAVAVVGGGPHGLLHIACWREIFGVVLTAVCDPDPIVAARMSEITDGAPAFAALPDLLAGGPFDLLDVCLPVEARATAIEQGILAGCHVVAEMPFSTDPEIAERLADLAASRERLLIPVVPRRFLPLLLLAQELNRNDDFGRIAQFRYRTGQTFVDEAGERDLVWDEALHGIDLFRAFCGEVASVTAKHFRANPVHKREDTLTLLLQATNGTTGVFETGFGMPALRSSLEISGTAGGCFLDLEAGEMHYLAGDQLVWQSRSESGPSGLFALLAHSVDAIRGFAEPQVRAEDAVRAIAFCAALND